MEKILFLTQIESDGSLSKAALETLNSAVELKNGLGGASLAVGLVGENAVSAANTIGSCGAEKFVAVSGPVFTQARYKSDALAVETLCRETGATVVVIPSSLRWARVASGVATRLNGRIDSHVTSLAVAEGKAVATRWFYRQRIEGSLDRSRRPWFLLIEPGSSSAWQGAAKSVDVANVAVALKEEQIRTKVEGVRQPATDEQTIRPDAELLFVTGAGWTKKQPNGQVRTPEAAELILGFLRGTHASLGSSKSLVDMDSEGQGVLPFLSHLNQVGQTGATPRHPKGLATCCHGEEPHVVGWRFINERRAVNLNPSCGWAQGKADVLYVADAFEVIAEVNKLLQG